MSRLVVDGLAKSFGAVEALRDFSAEVDSATLAAVLGPSGCGKTTLLRCVAGFEHPDAGAVYVDDHRIDHSPVHSRRIAVVPQEGALFPHLTVDRNVAYGLPRAGRRGNRVAEVLELVGLHGYGRRMPHELSGGQQQRVAVARALAPRPALVMLDEPFSALDAALRAEVRADVRAALHADGATAVLVTHDQAEALSMADQVLVMRDGRLRQSGTPQQVYDSPADPWVAEFVGEAMLVEAVIESETAQTALGRLPLRASPGDGPATVLIRPEQVALSAHGSAAVSAHVDEVDYFGHDALVKLRLRDGSIAMARTLGGSPPAGSEVGVSVAGTVQAYEAQA